MNDPSVELHRSGLHFPRLIQMAANHALIFFFVIAFAFSWLVFLPMILFHSADRTHRARQLRTDGGRPLGPTAS